MGREVVHAGFVQLCCCTTQMQAVTHAHGRSLPAFLSYPQQV